MTKSKTQMADVEGFHDAKQPKVKDTSTADIAVDTVNPGAEHQESISGGVEDGAQVQYQLDPQAVQQVMQNRNARLIAMMVNENAMMEVALEQERAAKNELLLKVRAMQEAYGM